MDNFYRAKDKKNNWVYGIYLPLLDGACIIPDDAAICKMNKTVDGCRINGHLIETVEVDENTLGLCLGIEDNNGNPVFAGDYLKINMEANAAVLLVKEKQTGFKLSGTGFCVNAVKYLQKIIKNGGSFSVIGNIYDNAELMRGKSA